MAEGWNKGAPTIVELQHRLRLLVLRMERVKIAEQFKRTQGMLRAMAPKKEA